MIRTKAELLRELLARAMEIAAECGAELHVSLHAKREVPAALGELRRELSFEHEIENRTIAKCDSYIFAPRVPLIVERCREPKGAH